MKRIRDQVGGLDVHRDTVVACTRVVAPDGEVEVTKQSFATTRKGLGELAVFLADAAVKTVAMEATGVYWKAPYYALEGLFDARPRWTPRGKGDPAPREGAPRRRAQDHIGRLRCVEHVVARDDRGADRRDS